MSCQQLDDIISAIVDVAIDGIGVKLKGQGACAGVLIKWQEFVYLTAR